MAMSGITDAYQPSSAGSASPASASKSSSNFAIPSRSSRKITSSLATSISSPNSRNFDAVIVCISLTTLDPELAKTLEPRASTPNRRLAAIREFTAAGVPVRVLTAPIIPGLNDHEFPALLAAAAEAGALDAGYTLVRLPLAVEPIFIEWLERHRPGEKEKILGRIREHRDGVLYRGNFGERMGGAGPAAEQLSQLFQVAARRAGRAAR